MDLFNVVKNIGLTDKEARVYLACLELGSSSVSEIARRARINRVTTYDVLEKLLQKGMVHYLEKNGKTYFDATDPHKVSSDMRQRTDDFKHALPEFKRLRGEAIHPRIRYYEGLDGIKAIYEDTLTSKTEILNYSNSREIREHWPAYDKEYVQKRADKKIFLRGISPLDDHGKWVRSQDNEYHREIRLVPSQEFTFTNEINIYDDKVAIISYKDVPLIGMIIESQEIANTQRDIFKMAWEFALKHR
ncbi:hypothetical protein KBD59_05515 [Candidatus Gracilibacteria bacterium]|nr:hypothetical protein [Candidatus Gracilibacteria bacterium]